MSALGQKLTFPHIAFESWCRSSIRAYQSRYRPHRIMGTYPTLWRRDAATAAAKCSRFTPPSPSANCFIVRHANGQALSHVYYESEPGRD
jgi:hypothetical protein